MLSGGKELFLLIIIADITLGPLITFFIFNKLKSTKEKILDFSLIVIIQLSALGYGLWTTYTVRPIYLVFEYSRFSILHAVDISSSQLDLAPKSFRSIPVTGPQLLALRPFKNSTEEFEATMAAIDGSPLAARTDLWSPYEQAHTAILAEAKPVEELLKRFPNQASLINQAIADSRRPTVALRYLPVVGRKGVWVALVDTDDARIQGFIDIDPFLKK
ncbi:pilus assembly protein [Paenacidovorax monticola]|uniref:pilus assembly protein n=1 Tax=Paenacidovorax monticola TaxID=1926868 RepID=UPI001FE7205A|nr:pilus assembly protein [Paenacidovorax monticola]